MALVRGLVGRVPSNETLPANEAFLCALGEAIVGERNETNHAPSTDYTPSGLNCIRQMWYKRRRTAPEPSADNYQDVGASATGIARHEAIQSALLYMNQHSNRFLYIDVSEYVNKKHESGKCLDVVVTGMSGAETKLYDKKRHINFRCDGIIYDSRDKHFYLFEFKNQISYKAADKLSVDTAHYCQVHCYCAELDLDDAFVVYENRDTCQLYIPEILHVTPYNKQAILSKIDECEKLAISGTLPARPQMSAKECQWCRYRKQCRADGPDAVSGKLETVKEADVNDGCSVE